MSYPDDILRSLQHTLASIAELEADGAGQSRYAARVEQLANEATRELDLLTEHLSSGGELPDAWCCPLAEPPGMSEEAAYEAFYRG